MTLLKLPHWQIRNSAWTCPRIYDTLWLSCPVDAMEAMDAWAGICVVQIQGVVVLWKRRNEISCPLLWATDRSFSSLDHPAVIRLEICYVDGGQLSCYVEKRTKERLVRRHMKTIDIK